MLANFSRTSGFNGLRPEIKKMDPTKQGKVNLNKMQVTINFGIANSITKNLPEGTTVGAVLADRSIMAGLGFGDNVVGKIDGQTQDGSRILRNGDHLDVEVRANTKAVKKVASPEAQKEQAPQSETEPQSEAATDQEAAPAAESSQSEPAAQQA